MADYRLPIYLTLPIRHKHICHEPMLGPIQIEPYLASGQIEYVLCGGESGPRARPCHYEWVLDTRAQCVRHGVAFHFKQTGAVVGAGHPGAVRPARGGFPLQADRRGLCQGRADLPRPPAAAAQPGRPRRHRLRPAPRTPRARRARTGPAAALAHRINFFKNLRAAPVLPGGRRILFV